MSKLKLTGLFLGYLTLLWYTLAVSFAEGQITFGGGGGGGAVTGWPNILTSAAATSEASDSTKIRIRGTAAQSTSGANFYQHSNGVFTWVCVVSDVENACDYIRKLSATFKWGIQDASGNAVFSIFPSAGSMPAVYPFGTGYYPLKTVWFDAGSLSTDGTQCAAPAEVTLNSGPKTFTIICTDNDSSTMYGKIKMPDSWDAGTVTFTHVYLQTAADTSALNGDIAAQCKGNGEAVNNTWGSEVAIDDAAVTGSNQNDFTTSAAVTPNGTCAAGDMLYFRYQLDATGTTTAVATLHTLGFKMEYGVTSLSD